MVHAKSHWAPNQNKIISGFIKKGAQLYPCSYWIYVSEKKYLQFIGPQTSACMLMQVMVETHVICDSSRR